MNTKPSFKYKKDMNTYNVFLNGKRIGRVGKYSNGRFGIYWLAHINGVKKTGMKRSSAVSLAYSVSQKN